MFCARHIQKSERGRARSATAVPCSLFRYSLCKLPSDVFPDKRSLTSYCWVEASVLNFCTYLTMKLALWHAYHGNRPRVGHAAVRAVRGVGTGRTRAAPRILLPTARLALRGELLPASWTTSSTLQVSRHRLAVSCLILLGLA